MTEVPEPIETEPAEFSADYVKSLRNENAAFRVRATAAERERDQARAEAAQRVIRAELRGLALREGVNDPEDVLRLADLGAVALAEDGSLAGGLELIASIKAQKPYLFKAGGTSSVQAPPRQAEPVVKSALDMTKEEYAAARKKLSKL